MHILLVVMTMLSVTPMFGQCTFLKPIQVEEATIGNLITWSTDTEVTNLRFLVQKSLDGWNFESIGELKGMSEVKKEKIYRFLDYSIGQQSAYYRLMTITSNGSFKLTPSVFVQRDHPNNLMISGLSPTVTDKFFNFTVRSTLDLALTVTLFSMDGKSIRVYPSSLIPGSNLISLDVVDIPNGTYRILLDAGDEKEEIVIQKIDESELIRVAYLVKE
ncbi:MAG: hypothetical protein KA479_10385 [Saprospiraceae bacterium]|nr:hypothetical protein [Saprospiraceae bacterium]